MREIKFRGVTDENELVYPNRKMFGGLSVGEIIDRFNNKDQFTGLKDKNGKGEELYDGDIIINGSRNGKKPHAIVWSQKMGAWCGDYGLQYLIAQELHEITKVGNIRSNPELIK